MVARLRKATGEGRRLAGGRDQALIFVAEAHSRLARARASSRSRGVIEDLAAFLDHPQVPALRDANRFRVREQLNDPSRVLNRSDYVVLAADDDCWYLADDLEGLVLPVRQWRDSNQGPTPPAGSLRASRRRNRRSLAARLIRKPSDGSPHIQDRLPARRPWETSSGIRFRPAINGSATR